MSSGPTLPRFVFVDFENVPNVDLRALGKTPAVVFFFIGLKSKLPKDLIDQMTTQSHEIRLIKVGVTKKNALDFVLTYHLGATIARHPGASCHIVSGDRDFATIVAHLKTQGIGVSCHPNLASVPLLPAPTPILPRKAGAPTKGPNAKTNRAPKDEPADPWQKIVAHLKNAGHPRPSTRARLVGYLKNVLGKDATDAKIQALIERLHIEKVLNIDRTSKVSYL